MKKTFTVLMTVLMAAMLFISCDGSSANEPSGYKVSFDLNGGSGDFKTQIIAEGKTASKPETDPTPSNANYYVFDCWTAEGETTEFDFSKVITADTKLVAKWKNRYEVGDNGPAGGYIFYVADKVETGTYVDENGVTQSYQWKYLEAAPSDLDGSKHYFGCNGPDSSRSASGTSTAIGSGRENTRKLVNSMGTSADISMGMGTTNNIGTNYAAYLCDDHKSTYEGKEFTDWFLPSAAELAAMYNNLKAEEKGGTWQSGIYWSSSEFDSYPSIKAFVVNFGANSAAIEASRCLDGTSYTAYIRPIRAF